LSASEGVDEAAIAWAAIAACCAMAGPAQAQSSVATQPLHRVDVVAVLSLPRARVEGVEAAELSALAWNPSTGLLHAASDKGRLFTYRLRWQGRVLDAAEPVHGQAWPVAPGQRRPNIEGLALAPAMSASAPARLLVAAETGATAFEAPLPLGGVAAPAPLAWPAAISRALADPALRHGVEAIEWHPRHGLLAALQRPAASEPGAHAVHAADGTRWSFTPAAPRADVKAIERLDGERLLVLERARDGNSDGHRRRFVLRELRLAECVGTTDAAACRPLALPIVSPLLDGNDNFEGLACIDETTCLIVSDDGSEGAGPTRLVQLRLAR
jgi:Esterase-like activity of phytase